MSNMKQEYPINPDLPQIIDHNNLPANTEELGRITYNNNLYLFIKNVDHLSIVSPRYLELQTGTRYYCTQHDFPMKLLHWLKPALYNFQRPPSQGGLHAGAMQSKDENVDGEMLSIIRAMGDGRSIKPGYFIYNFSRNNHPPIYTGDYCPQS
ncbi:hypothetical protein L4C36_17900, partial [Photobacterium japonica]|uniref:hypothetical protein n=1 Tax=Photobacterium japonica TaxID=2910235 RepID=UPI003D0D8759